MPRTPFQLLPLLAGCALVAPSDVVAQASSPPAVLANEALEARFDDRGLVTLTDRTEGSRTYRLDRDGFRVAVDGRVFRSADLPDPTRELAPAPGAGAGGSGGDGRITYAWDAAPYRIEVMYELRPDWAFVSKRILVTGAPGDTLRVDSVAVFDVELGEAPADVFVPRTRYENLGTADYGAALRFADGHGLLAVAQNPFLHARLDGRAFELTYAPDMAWRPAWGPFPADRGLLAPYRLTGRTLPARPVPEWRWAAPDTADGMDRAEVQAFRDLVRAFLLYRPEEPVDVFVAWTANDYQIDIATPGGRDEYARMLDEAAAVGAEHVVFAPTNSDLSRRVESADYWSWENLLWLGLGQKIRRGEWDPRTDAVPASVQAMLDHARDRGLGLMAYVYPVIPFSRDPEWLVDVGDEGEPRYFADLGVRSLQDWLIQELVAFKARTGVTGYAFDHTFLRFPGTSAYAQWWGWRRVMEELRRREPELVIDGRQAYHLYGPWSWLAGSYPHPTMNDEQPESFVAFPDLHIDRVSADRQRFTAWVYRNLEFTPAEITPGFMTHQTPRNDDTGRMPQRRTDDDVFLTRFRARDWDWLGWRYSVLSSVATAGWANVLSMLPARDTAEYRAFSDADEAWLRGWLAWTEQNKEYLRHTRTILGPPAIGKVDGTTAILGDRGFVFLFNPNARAMDAVFSLDDAIGLKKAAGDGQAAGGGQTFVLREIHPLEGRRLGKPGAGVWRYGDRVTVPLGGASARVLEIAPAPAAPSRPVLFGAPGTATLSDGSLALDGVRGEVGTVDTLWVQVADGSRVASVRVNGRELPFARAGDVVRVPVRFAGTPFHKLQPVGTYDPDFTGGTFRGRFTVPPRIFEQLRARQEAWPIPWDPEDYRSTWLAPQRLLLHVQIAEPDDRQTARLRLDGQPVELTRAYSSVRPVGRDFLGYYADVSLLEPGRAYEVELELPELRPGQFQGLFFENVETEYTEEVRAPGTVG